MSIYNYNYGFIITRHVNSEKTNKYWNKCVSLINYLYPNVKIVIIDDNSDKQYIKNDEEYNNVTIIESEYPKRGELLPFIYYLKHKWFENAIIIHDSLFIHKRISFEKMTVDVIPLWHHKYDKENLSNIIRISSHLKSKQKLVSKLNIVDMPISLINNNFNLCFGCQCYIKLSFLEKLQEKYDITKLVNTIHNRPDRCSLERIIGLLFHEECPELRRYQSMFGNIKSHYKSFNYSYDDYMNDYNKKKIKHEFVKIWTGR
jgi:hypothetical protein